MADAAAERAAWDFGEEPLAQTERFAAAVRRVSALAMALESPSPVIESLTAALEAAEAELAAVAPADLRPRLGEAATVEAHAERRVYLDHAFHVGRYAAAFPIYELHVDGDHAEGRATFPVLYEGPPGCVHGGFVAVLFDQVVQHHNCALGVAGKTAGLEVRYRAPTPLLVELRIEVDRTVDDRWIHSTATLSHGDVVCATATMRALAGDRASLPAVDPRRPS